MSNSAAEKTEEPTPKKLREAREKGQVPRSRELATLFGVAGTVLVLVLMGRTLVDGARGFMVRHLRFDAAAMQDPGRMAEGLATALADALIWLLPFLLGGLVAAFAAPVLFGGWNWSGKALLPDPERLNPLAGLKRIFSLNALMELLKAVAKFVLLGGIAVMVLWGDHRQVLGLGQMDLKVAMAQGLDLCISALAWMCIGLAMIAAIDAPFQYFSHRKKLKMTLQEVKDEMKETEGRPEVKQQQRQLQQLARSRMAQQIPGAQVILNNPTHYAVALRYAPDGPGAPVVVAKGSGILAEVIRDLGREHRIPQLRLPPLARALYHNVEVDQEIPGGLYLAVAQVLSYVFALQQDPQRVGAPPDPEVPNEFRWDPDAGQAEAATAPGEAH